VHTQFGIDRCFFQITFLIQTLVVSSRGSIQDVLSTLISQGEAKRRSKVIERVVGTCVLDRLLRLVRIMLV
jgi:hypothetical protein